MSESRAPTKYTGHDPAQLEGFLRHFVRYYTTLKADWITIWEALPPAEGLQDADLQIWNKIRDARIQANIKEKLALVETDKLDESKIKAFKRTMGVCACSALRDFLGGQALTMVPTNFHGLDNPLKDTLERLRAHADSVLLPIRYEKYRSLMATFMSMDGSLNSLQDLYDTLTEILHLDGKLGFDTSGQFLLLQVSNIFSVSLGLGSEA
jgi:hypothetical protein